MAFDHVLEDPDSILPWVRSFDREDVRLTRHFEDDVLLDRVHINVEEVLWFLFESDDLIGASYNPPGRDPSYILVFDRSNQYYLKIVVSGKQEALILVTAHLARKTMNDLDRLLKRR